MLDFFRHITASIIKNFHGSETYVIWPVPKVLDLISVMGNLLPRQKVFVHLKVMKILSLNINVYQ